MMFLPKSLLEFGSASSVVEHSVVTQGCEITGTVKNSVLSHGARVEDGAEVHYSVLMPGVTVKRGAVVRYAILGENCQVEAGAGVGGDPESRRRPPCLRLRSQSLPEPRWSRRL